jgi:mRNA-degrading endonuclease toxin of MazEF toxin-antitoxin module
VAAITSQLRYSELPGNVQLRRREGGLPKAAVVNVTQISTIDREHIEARLGQLSSARLGKIWQGVRLILEPPSSV